MKYNITDRVKGNENIIKDVIACAVMAFFSFIILMSSPSNPWTNSPAGADSSVFQYMGMVIQRGGMPYRDAFDHKGPLMYLINYLGRMISTNHGIWIVESAFLLLLCIYMYRISRILLNRVYSLLSVIIVLTSLIKYYDYGNMTEEYAMTFIAIASYIFIDYFINSNITKIRLIVCGTCFGAVFFLRANMIALWIALCIAVLVFEIRSTRQIPWKFLGYFSIGAGLVIIPFVVWLIAGGAFGDFIQAYFVFNSLYTSKAELVTGYGKLLAMLNWMSNRLIIADFIIVAYLIYRNKRRFLNTAYLGYMIITMYLISMSAVAYNHYGMILIPLMLYPLISGIEYLNEQIGGKAAALASIVLVMSVVILPEWLTSFENISHSINEPHRSLNVSEEYQLMIDFIQASTSEDEKIMVLGNCNDIYIHSNRLAATKYSYQWPIVIYDEKILDEFKLEMSKNQPKIVILQDYRSADLYNIFADMEKYEQVCTIDDQYGVYRLKLQY